VECPDADALQECIRALRQAAQPFRVIGEGTNIVVADEGLDAVILRYCSANPVVRETDEAAVFWASGSTRLDALSAWSAEQGRAGLDFAAGIPGTLAGAIAGNAGAFGQCLADALVSVDWLDDAGGKHRTPVAELGFSYRTSYFQHSEAAGAVITGAHLHLPNADSRVLLERRAEILGLRRAKHPDWHTQPCAGSVFRNIEGPRPGDRRQPAGRLLEEAGAKSMQVGGARVFDKHANIIVAEPGCTARDIRVLTERMQQAVVDQFGIRLVLEIRFLP
jgi:UDP-N-acetylmuramate dehydrogenase